MSDIKSVVGLLSKIIGNFYNINLKAEHFRLAKYDKEDENIVPLFWNLLNNCCNQNNSQNLVINVKLYFTTLGYKNIEFYSLPEDMSKGSRELLIAFSWLLQKEKILDIVLKRELSNSEISKEFNLNGYINKNTNTTPELSSVEEYYNYILWISGKINNNIKQISDYKLKTQKLASKVHKDTQLSRNSSHLTINETVLLKNHDCLKNYLHRIQKIGQMLDYYHRWKTKESFFWEWMLTVMKEKENNNLVSLDIEILENFFIELQRYTKKVLMKNDNQINKTTINDNSYCRCIYAPKSETNSIPEAKQLLNVQEKHKKYIDEISEVLKLYCTNKIV